MQLISSRRDRCDVRAIYDVTDVKSWCRSVCVFFGFVLAASAASGDEYMLNALAPDIEPSPIRLELEPFLQLPPTSEELPRTKINMLKPFGDGSGRLAVSDLRGPLYIVSERSAGIYLDLSTEFGEFYDKRGLGVGFASFAFHPDFARNGLFYTTHNEPPQTAPADFAAARALNSPRGVQAVLTEWKAVEPGKAVFAGSRRELMRFEYRGTAHGIQEIAFNPNLLPGDPDYGNLYVCVGEGSSRRLGLDGQQRAAHGYGSVLRIDPLGRDSDNGQYGIPATNPWANDDDPETRGEVYAYGFRNPHRLTWDSAGDGKAIVTEIGESNIEEVNILKPGLNYGWSQREGTFRIEPSVSQVKVYDLEDGEDANNGFSFTYPVAQYDHGEGMAISGGAVYRGAAIPMLQGAYVFGDIVKGRVFGVNADELELGKQSEIYELLLEIDGKPVHFLEDIGVGRVDLRIGTDLEGELYLMEKMHGNIYKVVGARRVD